MSVVDDLGGGADARPVRRPGQQGSQGTSRVRREPAGGHQPAGHDQERCLTQFGEDVLPRLRELAAVS
ncbi:MAG: hypothetical protein GEV00_12335 [Actinophytocola sp.]|nr:hypothetical protein [Actinophytocola sp.]